MKISNKFRRVPALLFHLAYGLFLLSAALEFTTFSDYPFLLRLIGPLRKLGWLLAGIKIAIEGAKELRSKKYKLQWFPLLFFVGMAVCYYFCRVPHILSFSLFILAARGISFQSIARHTLLQQGATMLLTIFCYLLGLIKGIDFTGADGVFCTSLGFNSANCLMLVGFQIILLYGYLRKDHLRWYHFLLMGAFAAVIYIPAQGRIGLACILLILLAMAIWRIQWVQKALEKLRFFIKPLAALLCLLILGLAILYPQGPTERLNGLFSDRLRLTHEAMEDYGITPFGQQIQWVGQRGKTLGENTNYNYVDSSYAKALFDYGAVPLLLFLVAAFLQKNALYRKKEYLLLLFLIVIELYCFFESFWLPPIFNTTIFLMKEPLYPLIAKENQEKE